MGHDITEKPVPLALQKITTACGCGFQCEHMLAMATDILCLVQLWENLLFSSMNVFRDSIFGKADCDEFNL